MLTIEQLTRRTEVLVTGDAALHAWWEEHSYPVPGREYMPRYKHGKWDGMYRPGRWCRLTNTGRWQMRCSWGLARVLASQFGVTMGEQVPTMEHSMTTLMDFVSRAIARFPHMRDYQRAALTQLLSLGWGRVALATNAGKGMVIALLADFASSQNMPVLILCDEVAVFEALLEELHVTCTVPPAVLSAGVQEPPTSSPIVLSMVPTLARRLKHDPDTWRPWLQQFAMLLMDEADKALAPTWRAIVRECVNTTWRAGFSGTFPEDLYENLLLDEMMGPVVVKAKNIELVERGISAKPQVELHGFKVTTLPFTSRKKWWKDEHGNILKGAALRQRVYEDGIVYNTTRHYFIAELIRPGAATAVVVNRIEHGKQLAMVIPDSVFLEGANSPRERREVLARFRAGEIPVIIVTKILDRGTNQLGHTADLIFASGEGSSRQNLQRIGRGLRRAGGKEFLRLVDIIDRGHSYFHTAGQKRIALYGEEGFEVVVRNG